jgi:hypothetical protein
MYPEKSNLVGRSIFLTIAGCIGFFPGCYYCWKYFYMSIKQTLGWCWSLPIVHSRVMQADPKLAQSPLA